MIAYAVVALLLLAAAVQVVRSRDLVHAVLWLGVVLVATAGAYLRLQAGLLAAIQVMLYAGGVVTLMIFAVMLTARHEGGRPVVGHRRPIRAAVLSLGLLAVLAWQVLRTPLPGSHQPLDARPADLGALLLQDHLLAFEALSVLLLAAMVGAILLARRRDA